MHLLKVSISAAAATAAAVVYLLAEQEDLPSFSASSLSCTVCERNN